MNTLRNWLWAIGDSIVADQHREIASLRSQLDATTRAADQATVELRRLAEARLSLLRLLDAVLSGIGFEIGQVSEEWKDSPAAARHAVGAHLDSKLEALELRASKAERDAEDLRSALNDERQQHDQTRGALAAAEAENKSVWAVIERDRARLAAETAIANRRRAAAETDARRQAADDEQP